MDTKFLTNAKLPLFLPHGWKEEVAKALGVHRNTIHRNLKRGKGEVFNKIVMVAAAKYGNKEVKP